jgi:hypothetical protein
MTEGFQVPMVAYDLDVKILRVQAAPLTGQPIPPAPNVIFQARANRKAALLPSVHTWPATHYRLVALTKTFRVFAQCVPGASL